jgi:hypothetical protein
MHLLDCLGSDFCPSMPRTLEHIGKRARVHCTASEPCVCVSVCPAQCCATACADIVTTTVNGVQGPAMQQGQSQRIVRGQVSVPLLPSCQLAFGSRCSRALADLDNKIEFGFILTSYTSPLILICSLMHPPTHSHPLDHCRSLKLPFVFICPVPRGRKYKSAWPRWFCCVPRR